MPYNPYYAYETVKQHLYNSENWSKTQLDVFTALYGFQPWHALADMIYGSRKNQEYLDNYPGVSIHDPRNLPGTREIAGGYSSLLNFVSKNVDRLYK